MRCPHKNLRQQQCLDCGRDINESDEEYLAYLKRLKRETYKSRIDAEIEQLEKELGIKHPGNMYDGMFYQG